MYRFKSIAIAVICLALMFSSMFAVKKQTSKNKKNPKSVEQPKPSAPEITVPEADILAQFKGGIISKQDLEARISKLPPQAQGRYKTVEGQTQILDMISVEEVFFRKAQDMNVPASEAVKEKILSARKQVLVQEYYTRKVKDKVNLTEAAKQEFYQQNLSDFYVAPYLSINYLQAADEANALKALKELQKGADFASVSQKYNQNTYAKNINGRIKNIRLNGNIPGVGNDAELENLIKISPVDTLNFLGPQKTSTGWSIIQVVEKIDGRQRPYLECEQEVDQRLRPKKEAELLNQLMDAQKQAYKVVIDTLTLAGLNLREPDKNKDLSEVQIVKASDPSLNMTVKDLLDKFARMSPQEQMMYVKGGGPQQMVNQEISRNLMYLDSSKSKEFDEYLANNADYKQAERYYILQEAYKRLVVDSLSVSDDEIQSYYDSHLKDFTTPSARKISAIWPKDKKTAEKARKQFAKAVAKNNQAAIDKVFAKYNTKPELKLMDNLYDNGVVLGVGADEGLSDLIWDTPVGAVSPVAQSVKKDYVVFQVMEERPPVVKSLTEVRERLQGQLRKDKEKQRMEDVKQQLFTQYDLKTYPQKLQIKLTAEELFTLADDAARQRKYKDATVYYDQIIQFYPNGTDDYKASFMKAFLVTEEMGSKDQGLMLFKEFLIKYPTGELNESAQYMIDELEGRNAPLQELEEDDSED